MRRKDREIVDFSKIEKIISLAGYLHLGMYDEGYPYVVPLHYGYFFENKKPVFFVHCAKEGHKLECIKKNNNVFVEIDRAVNIIAADIPCKYGAEYECVMCRGKATVLTDEEEKLKGLKLLMKTQTGKDFEIPAVSAETVTVIRIDVDSYSAKARVK